LPKWETLGFRLTTEEKRYIESQIQELIKQTGKSRPEILKLMAQTTLLSLNPPESQAETKEQEPYHFQEDRNQFPDPSCAYLAQEGSYFFCQKHTKKIKPSKEWLIENEIQPSHCQRCLDIEQEEADKKQAEQQQKTRATSRSERLEPVNTETMIYDFFKGDWVVNTIIQGWPDWKRREYNRIVERVNKMNPNYYQHPKIPVGDWKGE